MLFDELIIAIMKAVNRERTVSSPFHLIKGKKSGQTIQDIGYYGLYPYFAVMPQLDKQAYDQAVAGLFARGLLRQNDAVIDLTDLAITSQTPETSLNGWKYRGNEALFLNRLSLIVQTFSHISQKVNIFDPVINSEDIQSWVKTYLRKHNFRDPSVPSEFKNQLLSSLEETMVPEKHKMILMQRLSGLGYSGLTWEQIAAGYGNTPLDVQLNLIETLHAWMQVIEQNRYPLLSALMEGVIQQSSLTESAQRTEKLFARGFSLEQIAELRQLKTSTIEDHFVELAMNDPYFNYSSFMSEEAFQAIVGLSRDQQTKRLRDIKEKLPEVTYFQIRLALAIK
ncbi:helix-turn-helix domain-containing protein [Planococcus shixiaomingii]|uniref:helix-turn-helix domain-containing protein n=1 Tax=Planococcus shixiaomingii TaxID=3058393 RepID=UPI0026374A13|nr:helix-turn-helix domain-containing protein [Planococcus sp. N022]WKA53383.1 helix-turn-helix domain-containing protein [Planococcus sp. N022]